MAAIGATIGEIGMERRLDRVGEQPIGAAVHEQRIVEQRETCTQGTPVDRVGTRRGHTNPPLSRCYIVPGIGETSFQFT